MSTDASMLPVRSVTDAIVAGVRDAGRLVLSAPTGSGKSTQVPQILLKVAGIEGEIIVLQPRRLAARLLAERVARELDEQVGGLVGYQIRFENRTSRETRIRFVTEGILLRRILADPELSGVGAVVFDEFHERHLSGDASLALALRTLQTKRPDLRLVVMSATLDVAGVSAFLAPCAKVEASGRTFPVTIDYCGSALGRQAAPFWDRAASAFRAVVRERAEGDILIFMPGAYEIRRTIEAIETLPEAGPYAVVPLHGELPSEAQDAAVRSGGGPKVVVSTNVAETSITIEGVRTVIDSGLARVARFDARRGINSLLVEPISRASAEQRAGRAGRTAPGRCLRLWSEHEHVARPERDEPEIRRVDLSETLLLMAASGIPAPDALAWVDPPGAEAINRSNRLLRDLGALDQGGTVTPLGVRMATFPLHPRFSRLLLEGARRGVLEEAALFAALSQGRPIYRAARERDVRNRQIAEIEEQVDTRSDFFVQLKAWELARTKHFRADACRALGVHGAAARQAATAARQLTELVRRSGLEVARLPAPAASGDAIRGCLLAAFSDQLAKRNDRGTRRCHMVHGRTGELRRESVVEAPLFVASEIEEREVRGTVSVLLGLATAVDRDALRECFPEAFETVRETRYEADVRRVVGVWEERFRGLVLEAGETGDPDPAMAASLLADEVMAGNLQLKRWNAEVENWIQRVNFVARHCSETEIPPIDAAARHFLVEQICEGANSYKAIKDRPVLDTVRGWIAPEQVYYLDSNAPEAIELPRRKRPVRIRYEADGRAVIAAKLQDFYDVPGSKLRLAAGRVALQVELLAPNGRPAHITDDLEGFWEGAYLQVRKELAGRYPKHEWR